MLLYKERSFREPESRVVWAWLRRCVGGEWVICEWVRREFNGNEAGVYSYTRLDQNGYEAVTGRARPELPEWQSDEKWHGIEHPAAGMPGGPPSEGALRVMERSRPAAALHLPLDPPFCDCGRKMENPCDCAKSGIDPATSPKLSDRINWANGSLIVNGAGKASIIPHPPSFKWRDSAPEFTFPHPPSWRYSAPEFTFPNRPIVPTQPAVFDVDIMGEPDPDRVDRPMTPMAEAMVVDLNAKYCHEHRLANATASIDCVKASAIARHPAKDPLRYTCRCHEILGNDFWFLPKGQCIEEPATAPHRPIGAKRGDKWTEVAAERDKGPLAGDGPGAWRPGGEGYDVT